MDTDRRGGPAQDLGSNQRGVGGRDAARGVVGLTEEDHRVPRGVALELRGGGGEGGAVRDRERAIASPTTSPGSTPRPTSSRARASAQVFRAP